ncbi:MAG: [FeFe] hydrogenase H-cluster maturation GTPase HydF [bacterium]|nr:[FeFe] hydrogenase H-cluster maturation GTPase HydF [bacterium]
MKQSTPKAQQLTIALVGRTNVGKSTLLNLIAGQDVVITSPLAGTTTDVVEKSMELLPFGPVLWLDTGGWNDTTALGEDRKARTQQALARADLVVGVISTKDETLDPELLALAQSKSKPLVIVLTHLDEATPKEDILAPLVETGISIVKVDADRDTFLRQLKSALSLILPKEFLAPPELLAGIVPKGGVILQIIPIDSQAPKGRIILPQVNVIRNALDRDYISIIITENRIKEAAERFHPDLAVCDSQVVAKMLADLPENIPATTYSILMARLKGDLTELATGATAIRNLKDGDTILIAEACTHHAADEDIGRVKIPAMLRQKTGKQLTFEIASGKDFPKDLSRYALIIHCGGCMINRAFMLWRIDQAKGASVPITNYGVAISEAKGILERVLEPFHTELPHANA